MQVAEEAKLIIQWADEIIEAAEQGRAPKFPRIPPRRYTNLVDEDAEYHEDSLRDIFQPGDFSPATYGIKSLTIEKLLKRYPGVDHDEFSQFSTKISKIADIIEENEHWVKHPMSDQELESLHSYIHDSLEKLAENNEWKESVEAWRYEDKMLAGRIFIALSYLLAWQKYTRCVLFMNTMATPWLHQMNEIVYQAIQAPELLRIRTELFCTRRRYTHFEIMIHGFSEDNNNGPEDIREDDGSESFFFQDGDDDEDND